jgi:hypothetical protein
MSSSVVQPAATEGQAHASESRVQTYRAAVVHEFGGPLTVERVPAGDLTPRQVRVKVEASGLSHKRPRGGPRGRLVLRSPGCAAATCALSSPRAWPAAFAISAADLNAPPTKDSSR